jgi:exonuclease SbcC
MKPLLVEMQAFGPFAGRQVIDFSLLGQKTFFLIHGPTGAGKTSILDAMCFALFGDSSGGERDGHQMRSHHADAATLTEVLFEFALGERRFRVRRTPDQERLARRGGGQARQPQTAEIHRLDVGADGGTEEVPLASGWRKVTDEVIRLLGFESKQFRQVIMLPQGQFFDFLKSTSQEREKILQTLFGTEIYRRIADRLSSQAKAVEEEAKESVTRRDTLLGQAEVSNEAALEERLKDLATQLAAAQTAEAAAKTADSAAEATVNAARQLADRFGELDKATEAFKTLKGQEGAKAQIRSTCERARSAAAVMPHAAAAAKAATKVAEEVQALASYQTLEQKAMAEAVKADSAVAAASQQAPEIEVLNKRLNFLDELKAKVQALHTARTQLAEADASAKQWATAQATAEKVGKEAAEQQAKALADLQTQQLLAAKVEGLKASVSLLEGQATKAAALAKAQTDAASAQKDQKLKVSALAAATKAEVQARTVRDDTHRAWVAGQAARLAAGLAADQACPVCGSAHHPAPAHLNGGEGAEVVHDDALEAAEEALRKAADLHNTARTQHEAAVRLEESLQARIADLRTDLGDVASTAAELKQAASQAQKDLKAAEAAAAGLAATQIRVDAAGKACVQTQEKLTQTTKEAQAAREKQQQCQAVLAEREKEVPPDLAAPEQLEQARALAAQQLAALQKAKDDAQAAATKAHETAASAKTRVQAAQESVGRLTRERDDAAQLRDQQLKSSGFEDLQAFEAARMGEEQLAEAEEDLKRFDTDLGAAQQRLQRATADTSNQQRPDVPALTAAHRQAEAAHLAASNAVRDVLAAEKTASKLAADLREQAAQYERLQTKWAVVKRVSDLANGVGGQRMSFQRYVLSTLLEEVLAATTQRLQVMSKGRYELRRAITAADKRAAAGLDLEAYDQYTGTVRPVTTLSGGESFLTSLALALGLSDVVQSYAGGIRLDAIFVDEGFGTLDTEALDFAIRALKDLQQSGRMVGIISHVTELREWIDARLEVKAGAVGSVAEFVV